MIWTYSGDQSMWSLTVGGYGRGWVTGKVRADGQSVFFSAWAVAKERARPLGWFDTLDQAKEAVEAAKVGLAV